MSKTKKNKPYYKVKDKKEIKEINENKDLTKNTTFMLGFGMLIMLYGMNYISNFTYSRVVVIAGMSVALYGLFYSYKKNVKSGSKTNVYIDYAMGFVIILGIIYNIYLLIFK